MRSRTLRGFSKSNCGLRNWELRYDGDEDIYQGLYAGARGYLLKDTWLDQIANPKI